MKKVAAILILMSSVHFLAVEAKKRSIVGLAMHSIFRPVTFLWSGLVKHTALSYLTKDNFHVVEKGKCFRSRQLKSKQFKQCIELHDIDIILNLQGEDENKKRVAKEKELAEKLHVKHITISLEAEEFPSAENIGKILFVFKYAREHNKRLLIHCKHGLDRTGLVSGLYAIEIQGKKKRKAKQHLSFWRHGHASFRLPAMKRFLDVWHDLRAEQSQHKALVAYGKKRSGLQEHFTG